MSMKRYRFYFVDKYFVIERKFSWWQWLLGRKKYYCPDCDRIEYWTNQLSIVGDSCGRCGYNPEMNQLINESGGDAF